MGGESSIATAAWFVVNSNLPKVIPNSFTVLADGSGDFADIGSAINALPTTGGVINLGTGTFPVSSSIANTTRSNIVIQGQGVGSTIVSSSITTDNPIFDFEGTVPGTSRSLTANATKGTNTATLSTGDAATFSAGQYVLIRSNKIWDSELSTKTGEIQKISSVNAGTGVVTFVDPLNDTYNTSDSASMIALSLLNNITFQDMSITSTAGSSARTGGSLFFRFINGVYLNNVEFNKLWWAGAQLSSCVNINLNGCNAHDTQDPSGAGGSTHYGYVIHAASRNGILNSCFGSTLRHTVTMGGQTGTNFEGVVRNVTVTNCTSANADTAHYDTHQGCEGIVFSSNVAMGGVPAAGGTSVPAYQIRAPRCTIIGAIILRTPGRGIFLFGNSAGNHGGLSVISGCHIEGVSHVAGGANGDAIYYDTSIPGGIINGCKIQDCDGHAVTGGGTGNNDINFTGNEVKNCCVFTTDGNINLQGNNVVITGNRFRDGPNRPIQMSASSTDSWTICDNDFTGMTNTASALNGTLSKVYNNMGYNPIGVITNPFPTSGSGNITNSSQAAAVPASGTTQTVVYTPKRIIMTGGTISNVTIDGTTVASAASNFYLALGVGETFSVTYSVAPTIKVYCD